MASIHYSVAGEGLAHAVRASVVVEELQKENRVTIWAPGAAHRFLKKYWFDTGVVVMRIPGLYFNYGKERQFRYMNSLAVWNRYFIKQLPGLKRAILKRWEKDQPDFIISDFDPLLPRAAQNSGIPYITVDHQYSLVASDMSDLPNRLKRHLFVWSQGVRMVYRKQVLSVASAFFSLPPNRHTKKFRVTHVGSLLRRSLITASKSNGYHILVYIKRFIDIEFLGGLENLGIEVRIYGMGKRERQGNLYFFSNDNDRFMEDLLSCRAVIHTAGNQLIGESLYLGKPILAIPETNNIEQEINGYYLEQSGFGMSCRFDKLSSDKPKEFISKIESFEIAIQNSQKNRIAKRLNGVPDTIKVINKVIEDKK